MLLAPLFGRVGGVSVAFLVPFLDRGIGQSPMLQGPSSIMADVYSTNTSYWPHEPQTVTRIDQ
jgi:hypothetical protein